MSVFQFKASISGFEVSITQECDTGVFMALVEELLAYGFTPLQQEAHSHTENVAGNPDNAPKCPYHGEVLLASRKRKGMLYCPGKNKNGEYCKYEVEG